MLTSLLPLIQATSTLRIRAGGTVYQTTHTGCTLTATNGTALIINAVEAYGGINPIRSLEIFCGHLTVRHFFH